MFKKKLYFHDRIQFFSRTKKEIENLKSRMDQKGNICHKRFEKFLIRSTIGSTKNPLWEFSTAH